MTHTKLAHLFILPAFAGLLGACAADVVSGDPPIDMPPAVGEPTAPPDGPTLLPSPIADPDPMLPIGPYDPRDPGGSPAPGDPRAGDDVPGDDDPIPGDVGSPTDPVPPPLRIAAYYLGKAGARPRVPVDKIDFTGVDDVMFAFVGHEEGRCALEDPENDEAAIADLAHVLPPAARMHLSLRTWDETGRVDLPSDLPGLAEMARSCAELVTRYAADGMDVAFPQLTGDATAASTDPGMVSIARLVVLLRDALPFDRMLTIAPPANASRDAVLTDEVIARVSAVHAIAYDLADEERPVARPLAPLFHAPDSPGPRDASTSGAMDRLRNAGVPAELTLLAVSFRARGYDGLDGDGPSGDGLHARAASTMVGRAGIEGLSHEEFLAFPGMHLVDPISGAEWRYEPAGRVLLASETARTLRQKRDLAREAGLGGVVIFDIGADAGDQRLLSALR